MAMRLPRILPEMPFIHIFVMGMELRHMEISIYDHSKLNLGYLQCLQLELEFGDCLIINLLTPSINLVMRIKNIVHLS